MCVTSYSLCKTDCLWWCNGLRMWLLWIKYSLYTLNPIVFPGHGDGNSRNIPTLVKDLSGIGQVSCGSSHTVAVSQDGWSVWSFGGGDNGILHYLWYIFTDINYMMLLS